MATGSLSISGNVTGGPDGSRSFGPFVTYANAAVTETLPVSLSIGANTVSVPTGSSVMVINPPNGTNPTPNPAWGGVLTLKGVSGDTGVPLSNSHVSVISWDSAPSSVVINSTTTGTLTVWFM
jgi:hypothetical protein